jgi:CBS domain-containing protein
MCASVLANIVRDSDAGDSAFRAFTDLPLDFPITIDVEAPIEYASREMTLLGIRALLVTQQGKRGIATQIVGLVTARALEMARSRGKPTNDAINACANLRVGDVMTSWDELTCLEYGSVASLTAMDLYEMFRGTGLTHILVIDVQLGDVAVARGVLSRATLAKQLGYVRHPTDR